MSSSVDRENEPDKTLVEPLLPPSESTVIEEPPRNLFLRLWDRRRRIRLEDTESEGPSRFAKLKSISRTKKIILILLLVTILLVLCIVVPVVVVVTKHRRRSSFRYIHPEHEPCVKRALWTPIEDDFGPPRHPHLRYSSTTSFTFNRSSDELYFVSGGGIRFHVPLYTQGSITFTNDGNVGINDVEVEVVASYNTRYGLRGYEVCTLSKPGLSRQQGVGIFSPNFAGGSDRSFFSINVKLPFPKAGKEGQPLYYGNIRTRLPRFTHRFGDLQGTAEFDTVNLDGAYTPFNIGSLAANRIDINSMNGNIEGVFNITERINLRTFSGDIRAKVNMESDGISMSNANLYSSDGLIDANLTLVSSADDKAKGTFRVNVGSSNAPVEITIPSAPLDHALQLSAWSSRAPINVHLPLTFEGSISLSSSPATPPKIEYDANATDPSGMGRHRIVEFHKTDASSGRGSTSWSPLRRGSGSVNMRVSESSVSLTL